MKMSMLLPFLLLGCRTIPLPEIDTVATPAPERPPEEIERYVERLGSKNAAVCLDAVEYIPYFQEDAIPYLVEALRDKNPIDLSVINRLRR